MNSDLEIMHMSSEEFIDSIKKNNHPIVLLLGAGCSRSSGIPCAKELAEKWAKKIRSNGVVLRNVNAKNRGLLNPKKYAENYFQLFLQAHTDVERKNEIISFTNMAYPSPGYVSLARILENGFHGFSCRIVISTNFDNLLEQAFYLFTNTTPILIPDESLVEHVGSINEPSIYIIKIHGDRYYKPLNEADKVNKINPKAIRCIRESVSRGSALVVIGYSGRDIGVAKLIKELVQESKIGTIYWVGSPPDVNTLSELQDRCGKMIRFFRVCDDDAEFVDFDLLMLQLENKIELQHVLSTKMDEHMFKHYDLIMQQIGLYGDNGTPIITLEAKSFNDYFSCFVEAAKQLHTSPCSTKDATRILEEGMMLYQSNPNYTIFMGAFYKNIHGDNKKAIELFKKAKQFAPNHAGACAELANTLKEEAINHCLSNLVSVKQDVINEIIAEFDMAETRDPRNLNNLLNYAGFLLAAKGSTEKAGIEKMKKCKNHIHSDMHQLEFAFYVFAHQLTDMGLDSAIEELLNLLGKARSPKFDLRWNVKRAQAEMHPQADLVKDIAVIINGEAGCDIASVKEKLNNMKKY